MIVNNDNHSISHGELYLRKACEDDCDLLFNWANDEIIRKNSFNTKSISYDNHVKWYKNLLADSNRVQYVLMDNNEPIGQVRLEFSADRVELGYSIDECKRGLGYGKKIISLAVEQVKIDYPNVTEIIAKVKPTNVASIHCFLKNNFEEQYQQYKLDLSNGTRLNHDEKMPRDIENRRFGGRILFLTNNINAIELFEWIENRCESYIYSGKLTVELLNRINPSLVVSYNYSHIVSHECIDVVNEHIVNMHISYLPYNRGASPNLWSFIDDTPKGVTIHMMSAGLDEGDILYQKELQFDVSKETFESTHRILNNEICSLFKEHWGEIVSGEYIKKRRRAIGKGSYHSMRDLKELQSKIIFDWSDNIADFLEKYNNIRNEIK